LADAQSEGRETEVTIIIFITKSYSEYKVPITKHPMQVRFECLQLPNKLSVITIMIIITNKLLIFKAALKLQDWNMADWTSMHGF